MKIEDITAEFEKVKAQGGYTHLVRTVCPRLDDRGQTPRDQKLTPIYAKNADDRQAKAVEATKQHGWAYIGAVYDLSKPFEDSEVHMGNDVIM